MDTNPRGQLSDNAYCCCSSGGEEKIGFREMRLASLICLSYYALFLRDTREAVILLESQSGVWYWNKSGKMGVRVRDIYGTLQRLPETDDVASIGTDSIALSIPL
jgi:hypothetical protein